MNLDIECNYAIKNESELNVKDICDNEVVALPYESLNSLVNQQKQYYSETIIIL